MNLFSEGLLRKIMFFLSILITVKSDESLSVWLWDGGWYVCVRYYCSGIPPCSLCFRRASGQHQSSETEGKHRIQACLQFVVGWSFACDLVVCFICLDMVGPYWLWATLHIIMRPLISSDTISHMFHFD